MVEEKVLKVQNGAAETIWNKLIPNQRREMSLCGYFDKVDFRLERYWIILIWILTLYYARVVKKW